MAGETAWLDGVIVWREGRVAWQVGERFVTPDGPAIALAQRRLNQIARHPHAAARALGDATAWLERRHLRLELAKGLHTSAAPDVPDLVRAARAGDASAVRRLAALLPAEALYLDGLPRPPSAPLVAHGRAASEPLREMLRREHVPLAGRAQAPARPGPGRRRRCVARPAPPDPLPGAPRERAGAPRGRAAALPAAGLRDRGAGSRRSRPRGDMAGVVAVLPE